ncbi:MAG TPA: hypothetical protein VMS21_05440, partial [Methylomirabilota bacterium]|nr:hypothetical protein [Methylomirabilota bacterium]
MPSHSMTIRAASLCTLLALPLPGDLPAAATGELGRPFAGYRSILDFGVSATNSAASNREALQRAIDWANTAMAIRSAASSSASIIATTFRVFSTATATSGIIGEPMRPRCAPDLPDSPRHRGRRLEPAGDLINLPTAFA